MFSPKIRNQRNLPATPTPASVPQFIKQTKLTRNYSAEEQNERECTGAGCGVQMCYGSVEAEALVGKCTSVPASQEEMLIPTTICRALAGQLHADISGDRDSCRNALSSESRCPYSAKVPST
jgi:hypothetical protein